MLSFYVLLTLVAMLVMSKFAIDFILGAILGIVLDRKLHPIRKKKRC